MHGKVTTWYMTEEERLAYIAKNPVVSVEQPKGTAFSNIHTYGERKKEANKARNIPRIIDGVDTNKLHELFMSGEKLSYIAKKLDVSEAILNNYIKEQRKVEPDKWPHRARGRREGK